MFDSHFSSIYSLSSWPADMDEGTSHSDIRNVDNAEYFNITYLSRNKILKRLESLDTTKGSGYDQIPPRFVLECADELAVLLDLIFNSFLATGVFPDL